MERFEPVFLTSKGISGSILSNIVNHTTTTAIAADGKIKA